MYTVHIGKCQQMWTHCWRSAPEHNVINGLSPINKLSVDRLRLRKWFGLFHSSNTADWSYILLILVRQAAYFPWVFKSNFMCELVVARLWKTDILTPHRCVNNSYLTHAQFTKHAKKHKQTHILHVCDVLFKVCCLMLDLFVEVSGGGGNSWLRLKGKHSTTDNPNNGQTNLILIRLSSVSTTCFTWQTCSRTSLCTTKAQHRLLSIIPKHWHDCTPLYSRPNYPGPL